ncbi:isochorismatase family cysteine hydrolase [Bordetella bronchiseptica]|uniref:Isochorismatase family protein n=2 Tax=Bordetella bronchiseptica TaxID=518 RepID=A0ABR4RHM3_BORBO|nr:isochorismatase family cysteine hydrolase [Bordetella bronchiseptica]SHP52368.1 nicotinamidase-like amidase [Mycobacteroides abscessus subsp. abscessus]AWP76861.1 hydrolase [Bordetella bronchiseptica]AZW23693.1 cysteine hydrolase [Bordetella bronchiseptica]KCV36605.1 isochorismatase family protein [Bordetella bronchiseptica 00-P-2796]KDB94848.1 isochorismatase family protein [Bordetella bronchiseptica E010]
MEFPQWVIDRVQARQGCLHPYDSLPGPRTAAVVIDMQRYFTLPGYQGECAAARAIVQPINRLCAAVRAAGGSVVWVQTASDHADSFWSHHHGVMLTPERSKRRLETLKRDSEGYALHPDMDARAEDVRVTKRFYSAMAPGSSELEPLLRGRGIDTLLIAGTVTNVCCESTARDAMMRDFRTIMVDDALAAVTPAEHENALHGWMLFFGDVLSVDEAGARLAAADEARRIA